jgi:hypothetical protein
MDSAHTLMTHKTHKMTQHHKNTDLATTGKFLAHPIPSRIEKSIALLATTFHIGSLLGLFFD